MWEIEIHHKGLNKYRVIRDRNKLICNRKAEAQLLKWNEQWEKIHNKETKLNDAVSRTKDAQEEIKNCENILKYALEVSDIVDWDSLKDNPKYPEEKPKPADYKELPIKPERTDEKYQIQLGFWDKVISSRRERKEIDVEELLLADLKAWEINKNKTNEINNNLKRDYELSLKNYELKKAELYEKKAKSNKLIDEREKQYFDKNPDAIIDKCEIVLSYSSYPENFPQEYELEYNPETEILIVEYVLPNREDMPNKKEVKYIQTRDEIVETSLSKGNIDKLYDSVIYQIALRTIYELYKADKVYGLKSITFNGWVNSIDRATGKEFNACIISLQANKDEFLSINLANVDPKICFKSLKGIGSSKLHSLTPVAPIMKINKEDKRFISSYDVTNDLDDSTNLAAMDWEDFEHLIREIFEKEFSYGGGEVKITRASRDGGVDAIAFDPDPIRGGKIVIQAKRYTNTVGVSAVRDLYGTVVNEGATKGILVTTADYGPDAYGFAKGKPITLLNGSNLLHLLAKHGHKATIDIKQARIILGLTDKNKL